MTYVTRSRRIFESPRLGFGFTLAAMCRALALVASLLAGAVFSAAQWQVQTSGTNAGLRGIHAVDSQIAWASGTEGTILKTLDGGAHWTRCAVPPDSEKLDFRGVWAWDEKSAVVLASGPGDQSRLYSTEDGCMHWSETSRNTDKDGFWDAVVFQSGDFGFAIGGKKTGVLIGDPVSGNFPTQVKLLGHGWFIDDLACAARPDEAAFAASNSSIFVFGSRRFVLGTGGKGGPRAILSPLLAFNEPRKQCFATSVPIAGGSDSSGIFSLYFRTLKIGVAVGGDYKKPNDPTRTAAFTRDGGRHWTAASKPPHGYRSSVAWDAADKAWIAAGTNGSDISRDDGKTWTPLDDGNWNAISLPFVVGPNGRIATLAH